MTGKQGQTNYLNSIEITGGTLQVGDYGHVYGADDLYYTAGTVGTGGTNTSAIIGSVGITIGADGALAFGQSAAESISNALTFSAGTSAISNINPNGAVTLSGTLTAASGFTKTGAGRVILAQATTGSTLAGTVTLKEGWLETTQAKLSNTSILFDGGGLYLIGDLEPAKITSNGGTLDYNSSVTLNGLTNTDTTSTPTFVITRSTDASNFQAGMNLGSLDGAGANLFASYTGTIQVDGNAIASLGSATDFSNTVFHLATNDTLSSGLHVARPVVGRVWKLGDLTGEGLVCTSKNPTYANRGVTFEIGSLNNDSTFSGTFANNRRDSDNEYNLNEIYVNKVGSGTWTFGPTASADSVFNADSIANITVKEGTLALARRSGAASAKSLTVEAGTELQILSEGQEVTGALTMNADSTLTFSLTGTEQGPMLSVDTLTFNDGAEMAFLLSDDFLENIDNTTTLKLLDATTSNLTAETFASFISQNPVLNHFFIPTVTGGEFPLASELGGTAGAEHVDDTVAGFGASVPTKHAGEGVNVGRHDFIRTASKG
ncbi:MAG: hypothetical protein Q4D98_07915 [Planctomycetia bacterium]|nr:hypothetical protein [Planctomycetia bacterium]